MPFKDPQRKKEYAKQYGAKWYRKHRASILRDKRKRDRLGGDYEWFEEVRKNILAGISTTTMPKEDCERWWSLLSKLVDYEPCELVKNRHNRINAIL